MNFLIKWPSRGRPDLFRETFLTWQKRLSGKNDVRFMVTIDHNDPTMNNPQMEGFLRNHRNTEYVIGTSRNKIDAFNRDLDLAPKFDVLVFAQDDVVPEPYAFDSMIAEVMGNLYPDLDGVIHFDDGYQHQALCTQIVMGRKYFERFGYAYHPDYISLWADNEYTEVAQTLGKITYIDEVMLRHNWHAINDAMRQETESFKSKDEQTYLARKAAGFPKESIFK